VVKATCLAIVCRALLQVDHHYNYISDKAPRGPELRHLLPHKILRHSASSRPGMNYDSLSCICLQDQWHGLYHNVMPNPGKQEKVRSGIGIGTTEMSFKRYARIRRSWPIKDPDGGQDMDALRPD
jgi:hypothetical protein